MVKAGIWKESTLFCVRDWSFITVRGVDGVGGDYKMGKSGEGGGGRNLLCPPPSRQVHNFCASPFSMVNMRNNNADNVGTT